MIDDRYIHLISHRNKSQDFTHEYCSNTFVDDRWSLVVFVVGNVLYRFIDADIVLLSMGDW